MDCPLVATVQALVIMSATEAAATRDARGWLYSGKYGFIHQFQVLIIVRNGCSAQRRPGLAPRPYRRCSERGTLCS